MQQLIIHLKNSADEPVVGVEIAVVASNGTENGAVSDDLGKVILPIVYDQGSTIMIAVDGYQGMSISDDGTLDGKTYIMEKNLPGGSTIIHGASYIPGIIGQFNPILDRYGRTYIHCNEVSFNDGASKPFTFEIGVPFKVTDNFANEYEMVVVSIIGTTSLINHRKIS